MLFVISNNCEYIYTETINYSQIISSKLQSDPLNIDPFEKEILWEACDIDLFKFSLIHNLDDDSIVINSKFKMIMNAIEGCCMLESLDILTSEDNYDTLIH